jgi:DNA (cytosine-5)-methyltransferase 1
MPTILDAYSGCGGLSLGAHQAGFETALAIDSDLLLASSFHLNFPSAKLHPHDIRKVDAAMLRTVLPDGVDGVVGGPPCQAFSEMGRRRSRDPRRKLIAEFFRIVKLAQPKFFLFENVRGLGFERNIGLLEAGLDSLPSSWKIVGPHLLNAADFGAPTRRLRLFVFGFDTRKANLPNETTLVSKVERRTTVRDAIGDLVSATEDGVDDRGYDFWKYDRQCPASDYASQKRTSTGRFTGHRKTVHTKTTLRRFKDLAEGEVDKVGKYPRLAWDGLCPTLRAGTGSDRGSYQAVRPIHPVHDRVITPREAARLQGFPDDFMFHPTVWHSCRMIGNSVSPIVAKTLLSRILPCVSA